MTDPSTTRVFGPATVAFRRAETWVIDEKPDKTLAVAASIPPNVLPSADMSRLRHRLDVAHAYVLLRKFAEALTVIQETREAAPEWMVQQRYARDILSRIIDKRRTLTPQMRELADFCHVPY
jgi:hypothetical protein